jgi:hypothetical protein
MLRAARATATIPVDGPPRAKAFYERTHGLEAVFEGEGFVLLAAGEETLVILYQPVVDFRFGSNPGHVHPGRLRPGIRGIGARRKGRSVRGL